MENLKDLRYLDKFEKKMYKDTASKLNAERRAAVKVFDEKWRRMLPGESLDGLENS